MSTESGIPDFRSVDGLYNQKYDYPPETILSHSFYVNHTEEFYRFTGIKCSVSPQNRTRRITNWQNWKSRKIKSGRNPEYRRTASGGRKQKCFGTTRQRSQKLLQKMWKGIWCGVHLKFQRRAGMWQLWRTDQTGCCFVWGRIEPADIRGCSLLYQSCGHAHYRRYVTGGLPAAGLIDYYRGNKLVLINKSTTSMDSRADLLIQAGLGEVFGQIEV